VPVVLLLLVGVIVIVPPVVLGLFLPNGLAAVIGLPVGAWLAWLAFNELSNPNE
jgi:hypothetical protein